MPIDSGPPSYGVNSFRNEFRARGANPVHAAASLD